MAVGAENVVPAHALRAVRPVVSVALQHRSQRCDAAAQPGAAAVVFKSDHDAAAALRSETKGEIAYHPIRRALGGQVDDPGVFAHLPVGGAVSGAEQLVSAADAQKRLAVFGRRADVRGPAGAEIRQEHRLLKILTSADKKQVVGRQIVPYAQRELGDLKADAPPFQPAAHAQDIAPVSVEIQHIRVQMTDLQLHHSQNRPFPARTDSLSRTVSMEV